MLLIYACGVGFGDVILREEAPTTFWKNILKS